MKNRARRILTVASCVLLIAAFAITPSYLGWAETSSSAPISAPVPVVTSVKPSTVMWGEVISIAGQGFGKDLGTVKVGNREAQAILSWTDTAINLQVPSGVDAGQASVVVKPSPKPAPAPKHTATGGPILIHNYLLPGAEGGFVPGVVTFRARTGADPFAIALRNGSEDPEPEVPEAEPGTKLSRYYRSSVESGKEESTILKLATDPDVEWAEPIYIGRAGVTPNDPRYTDGSQWGLNKVSAPLAWDNSQGTGVEVAIIDSGVKTDHEDLALQFLSPARDYTGIGHVDDCGHGTHVAGIAAAATNNAKGVAGMGWNTKFRSYKVLRIDSQNECSGFSNWFASAVNQAVTDGAEVINMSLWTPVVQACPDLLVTAFDNAYNNGRLVVTIAGNNSSENESWPSNCPNAFSVANSNPGDTLYTDPDDGSNFGSWVELTAPGVGILSSAVAGAPLDSCGAPAGQIYQYCTGTSMAAPFVSGAAALLYSLGASRATAAGLLKDASDPLTSGVCAQGKCGAGRLNAGDAVRALATRDHWVPTSQTYWFPWYDMTGGFATDDVVVGNKTSSPAKYRIWMGDSYLWGGKVPANQIAVATAPGFIGGPIRVVAPDGAPLTVSQRTLHQGSFAEVMAARGDLAATDTYFPWYDDTGMATWILVTNPSYTASASVTVWVGGVLRASPVISPNSTWAARLGVIGGPVRIASSVPVVASQRALLLGTGFNEVMGSRLGLLSNEYWFPWYDMTGGFANDYLLVAHAVGSQSVTVSIYIAGVFKGSQVLLPGQIWAPQFPGVIGGPVRVVCSGCGSQGSAGPFVIASQRVNYQSSFSEVPGTPAGAASGSTASEHWMPWYDSTAAGDDLLIANAGTSSASLSVIIGGQIRWSGTLGAGSTAAVGFVSLADGPVKVAGSAGSQLTVSQRVIWGLSFHETASGR